MRAPLVVVLLLAAVLAACGGGEDAAGASSSEGDALSQQAQEFATVSATEPTSGIAVTGPIETKPAIELPEGSPPPELVIFDVVEGTGAEVVAGSTVSTHYVGIGYDSREQFDASWDRGQPISFPLGNVIEGWQQGIPGMKVGGRRLLVIPGSLAYGDTPPPGSGIGANETLVFVIDLLGTG
jgi:peptidylprolyl isomerase